MRRRRRSAAPDGCCPCDCGLCGVSSSFCGRSDLLRPTCILACRIAAATCSFQTESLAEYERHMWSNHKDAVVSEKCFQEEEEREEGENPFVPHVAIKVEPEIGVYQAENNAKRGRKRKKRERYKEEDEDLVYDDDDDEDYDVTEEYYHDDYDGDWKDFKEEYYEDYEEEEEREISHTCGYEGCDFGADNQVALTAHEAHAHLKWVKRAFEANSVLLDAMVTWGADDGRWSCLKCGKKLAAAKVAATAHACQEHGEDLMEICCVDCHFQCKHPRDMRDHFKVSRI